MFSQYSIVLVNLDPTIGSEIKKTRPCVIISPNEMNFNINTVIIAPMTSKSRNYPTRIKIYDNSFIVLDQIRTIDKQRIIKKLGELDIEAILQKANITWNNVVKCEIFLTNIQNFIKVNVIYKEILGNATPARQVVEVSALPKGANIEISCIATINASKT